jgi:uncharacterized protein YggU (UPF0235/DUF167 family)
MYVKVSVRTDSSKEFVIKEGDGYVVAVKAPAERGLANKRVCELIRGYLGDKPGIIQIVSGHHSPHKILNIEQSS